MSFNTSFCFAFNSSIVFIPFISTNSFAFLGPIPYTFDKIFIGLFFSLSIICKVPVLRNSFILSIIAGPMFGLFFNSSVDVIIFSFKERNVSWAF